MNSLALDAFLRSIGAVVRDVQSRARVSVSVEFDGWLAYRRSVGGRRRLVIRIGPSWRRMFLRPVCRHIRVSCDSSDNGIPRLHIDGRLIEIPTRHVSGGAP